ncbi:MAG: hypothetical protein U0166_15475 [Acidobacteriota bacterium]
MNKTVRLMTFALAATLVATTLSLAATPSRTHSRAIAGKVSAMDEAGKTITVKLSTGKSVPITYDDATKITGGSLSVGERIRASLSDKGGKRVATTIRIEETAAAKTKTS